MYSLGGKEEEVFRKIMFVEKNSQRSFCKLKLLVEVKTEFV